MEWQVPGVSEASPLGPGRIWAVAVVGGFPTHSGWAQTLVSPWLSALLPRGLFQSGATGKLRGLTLTSGGQESMDRCLGPQVRGII